MIWIFDRIAHWLWLLRESESSGGVWNLKGSWKVIYSTGHGTGAMPYGNALSYAAIFNGYPVRIRKGA